MELDKIKDLFKEAKISWSMQQDILRDLEGDTRVIKSDLAWLERQMTNIIKVENRSMAKKLKGIMLREWKARLDNQSRL